MIDNYVKQPVVIEAAQITDVESFREIVEWINSFEQQCTWVVFDDWAFDQSSIAIHAREGNLVARPFDWIIRGVQGEFYPCRPEVFDVTYKLVTA